MSNTLKKLSPIVRVVCFLIVLASIIWGYWWLTVIFAIISLFIFPLYYEIIFWGILYDSVYGAPLSTFMNFPYVFTLGSIILFMISFFLRKRLLAYED